MNKLDYIESLKNKLVTKQKQLEELKLKHQHNESEGKMEFKEKVKVLDRMLKRQALLKILTMIKLKNIKTPFYLIKAAADYKFYKQKMLRQFPKPRRKQWWEKLMEEEYDYFYEKAGEKLK